MSSNQLMKHQKDNLPAWYEYVGAIHIHSSESDGSQSIQQIAKIGQKAGLDFLLFTDHMTLRPYHQGLEGRCGDTLIIIGYEIQDSENKNHYLVFGVEYVLPGELCASEYVRKVKEEGGLGIIAHPDEIRDTLPKHPSYPWTAWEAEDFDGIEIWNQMSEWMEKLTRFNQLKMVLSPRRILDSPTKRILKKWDELNKKRKVVGIGGVDAHAHPYKMGPFRIIIFPYKVQFKSIRTHILLDKPLSSNFKKAKEQVFSALLNCNVFASNYRRGDARGFAFYASGENKTAKIGEKIGLKGKIKLKVKTPLRAQIKLLRDGLVVFEEMGKRLEYTPDATGNYRVEAYRKKRGWIFSNHIRVS